MRGAWVDRKDRGSCNFCSDPNGKRYRKVFEFKADDGGGTSMVRICRRCLEELNKLARSK